MIKEMVRGDNKAFKFQRKDASGVVIETVCDEIYFTVKNNSGEEDYLIQKKLSDGTIIFSEEDFYYRLEILPEDTDDLPFGDYEIDVERIVDGKKKTLALGILRITKEITTAKNEV